MTKEFNYLADTLPTVGLNGKIHSGP